ncbi:peptide chain release factor N(5)-glutamine methyltransferase [Granulicella sp. dw_53]|uniref:peptide chain release factor N(5)-glutamine methyltransferase n=1 Tax=Granulicella sp. dw_53 TaxID=2719792 RepID=UPI001BD60567|nr:peptide chain release factor N(5)-glutamine methyltransferase [Granulicella sp. dw_53]
MTLREALTAATTHLSQNEHLRDTASRDAELLLLHTLQLPRTILLAYPAREVAPTQLAAYEAAIARRLALEPIQYITGTQEFYGLALHVTPDVLIPRPETELLVETVLQHLPSGQYLRIADVGTGSGAIAIAIAHHLPQSHITALDLSPQALAIARQNAETHHLTDRIRFVQSDLLQEVAGEAPFDAILSNPPYIPTTDLASLHPQVREHEPHTALFAGSGGLDIYTRLIPQAHRSLRPGGLLALEIGHGQAESIRQLLAQWKDLLIYNDLQQIPRTVLARKSMS